ncbi:MAG: hypothetical protein ACRCXZ_03095 [Patescibacteria group bacterium]
MNEIEQKAYSLEFSLNQQLTTKDDFDISQLENVLDAIYDKTETLDPELDLDISENDMYILTNEIDIILPAIKDIMKESNMFEMNTLELYELDTE